MDPWLESRWPDVHTRLIGYLADTLGDSLPDHLVARAEEHVSLEEGDRRADVAVVEDRWRDGVAPAWQPDAQPTPDPPVRVVVEEPTERWIEVQTLDGQLVTVIEVLSPSNKTIHLNDYFRRRSQYLDNPINLVEIDLLRQGATLFPIPDRVATTYAVCVKRMTDPGAHEVYPFGLRDRLPIIAIPLCEEDPDLPVDLQPLIDRVYEKGRYWMLSHDSSLEPPLTTDDLAWAQQLWAPSTEDPSK